MTTPNEDLKSVTYKGKTYQIGLHSPTKGLYYVAVLGELIAPALCALVATDSTNALEDIKSKVQESSFSSDMLSNAASLFFKNMNKKEFPNLVKELLSVVYLNNTPVNQMFDAIFIKQYDAIFFLLKEVIEHNGFLESITELLANHLTA